jgi:hypothetical protein
MIWPRRDTQIPLIFREKSLSRFSQINNQPKQCNIEPENIDRNDVNLSSGVFAPAPECNGEPSTLILIELPYFNANYIKNLYREPRYTNLVEMAFSSSFFDFVVEIYQIER